MISFTVQRLTSFKHAVTGLNAVIYHHSRDARNIVVT